MADLSEAQKGMSVILTLPSYSCFLIFYLVLIQYSIYHETLIHAYNVF